MKQQFLKIALILGLMASSSFAMVQNVLSGKVLETMNGGGYSYIKVQENKEVYWIAVKQTDVKVGETFLYKKQLWMQDFKSKSLNKTFDKILFALNASVPKQVEKNAWELPIKKPNTNKGQIANILKQQDALKDKTVSVDGTVVKVSRGIMNTSWVHIEDEYHNKLIFRAAKESLNVGDKVKASGTLNTNVDYGYGYTYKAIVVDATFTK